MRQQVIIRASIDPILCQDVTSPGQWGCNEWVGIIDLKSYGQIVCNVVESVLGKEIVKIQNDFFVKYLVTWVCIRQSHYSITQKSK